jgi:hypothetical protein
MVESHHHMLASENMLQATSVFRESHVCMWLFSSICWDISWRTADLY